MIGFVSQDGFTNIVDNYNPHKEQWRKIVRLLFFKSDKKSKCGLHILWVVLNDYRILEKWRRNPKRCSNPRREKIDKTN